MVKPETQLQIGEFLKTVAEAPRALLMLDYDGTLAPFHNQRDQAFPFPGITPVLQEIVRSGHTRVVIVSGRDVSEVVALLGIQPSPEVWGVHGLQRRMPDGTLEIARIEERHLDALSDADRWLGYQQLRHTAEFKTGSIAVHWRGLSDWGAEEVRGRVLMGWKPIAEHSGLDMFEFDGGVEIRAPEDDKGDVVHVLLAEMDPGTPAAYLGDDATDERAFRAIRGLGMGALVRPRWRHTAAQVWLKPPEEVLNFLEQWLEACRKHDARGGATSMTVGG